MEKRPKKRGRPKKSTTWTAKQLNDSAVYYFDKCDERTRTVATKQGIKTVADPAPYTVEGLCNHLCISTVTFRNWCSGDGPLSEKARLLRQRIADNRITGALDNRQNPAFARFMLVNNHADDYREKVTVESAVDEGLAGLLSEIAGSAAKPGGAE